MKHYYYHPFIKDRDAFEIDPEEITAEPTFRQSLIDTEAENDVAQPFTHREKKYFLQETFQD